MGRKHVDFIELADIGEAEQPGGAFKRTLSRDETTGAETVVLRCPAGWSAEFSGSVELLVLAGSATLGDTEVPLEGWARAPRATTLATPDGAELLLMADPDPAEGEIAVYDLRGTPWVQGVRGGPGGIAVKVLHEGATVSMIIANVPRYWSGAEFHDCPEELFVLAGDVEGRAGKMTAGSYFWRPEYITHGPYWSESGLLTFVRGHGDIVAHWIEDPDSTVEDNRAYLAALQG
jgi:hypothetical protein